MLKVFSLFLFLEIMKQNDIFIHFVTRDINHLNDFSSSLLDDCFVEFKRSSASLILLNKGMTELSEDFLVQHELSSCFERIDNIKELLVKIPIWQGS